VNTLSSARPAAAATHWQTRRQLSQVPAVQLRLIFARDATGAAAAATAAATISNVGQLGSSCGGPGTVRGGLIYKCLLPHRSSEVVVDRINPVTATRPRSQSSQAHAVIQYS